MNKIYLFISAGTILLLAALLIQGGCSRKDQEKVLTRAYAENDKLKAEKLALEAKLGSLRQLYSQEVVRHRFTEEKLLDSLKMTPTTITRTVIREHIDTVKTIEKVAEIILVDSSKYNVTSTKILRDNAYFQDSTFQLITDIFHEGTIKEVNYMLRELKSSEPATITNTVIKESTRRPRLYAAIVLNVLPKPNVELGLSYVDKKYRMYGVTGNTTTLNLEYKHPLIFSK